MTGFDPNTVMPVVGLLLVGAIALRSLQATVEDTPRGRLIFRLAVAAFVVAVVFTIGALVWRSRTSPPVVDGEMQVTTTPVAGSST